jgi:hypothetical protein
MLRGGDDATLFACCLSLLNSLLFDSATAEAGIVGAVESPKSFEWEKRCMLEVWHAAGRHLVSERNSETNAICSELIAL